MRKVVMMIALFVTIRLSGMIPEHQNTITTMCYSTQGDAAEYYESSNQEKFTHNNKHYVLYGIFRNIGKKNIIPRVNARFFDFTKAYLKQNIPAEDCLRTAYINVENEINQRYKNVGLMILASCLDIEADRLTTLLQGKLKILSSDYYYDTVVAQERDLSVLQSVSNAAEKKRILESIGNPQVVQWSPRTRWMDGSEKYHGFSIAGTHGFWDAFRGYDRRDIDDAVCDCLFDAHNLSSEKFYKKYNSDEAQKMITKENKQKNQLNLAQRLCYIAVSYLNSRENVTVVVQIFGRDPWLFNCEESD